MALFLESLKKLYKFSKDVTSLNKLLNQIHENINQQIFLTNGYLYEPQQLNGYYFFRSNRRIKKLKISNKLLKCLTKSSELINELLYQNRAHRYFVLNSGSCSIFYDEENMISNAICDVTVEKLTEQYSQIYLTCSHYIIQCTTEPIHIFSLMQMPIYENSIRNLIIVGVKKGVDLISSILKYKQLWFLKLSQIQQFHENNKEVTEIEIGNLLFLQKLHLSHCKSLHSIILWNMPKVSQISIKYNPQVSNLELSGCNEQLQILNLRGCPITDLGFVEQFTSIRKLQFWIHSATEQLELSLPVQVSRLAIFTGKSKYLSKIKTPQYLSHIQVLEVSNCSQAFLESLNVKYMQKIYLQQFQDSMLTFPLLLNLNTVHLSNSQTLQDINFANGQEIIRLELVEMKKLTTLSFLQNVSRLHYLHIQNSGIQSVYNHIIRFRGIVYNGVQLDSHKETPQVQQNASFLLGRKYMGCSIYGRAWQFLVQLRAQMYKSYCQRQNLHKFNITNAWFAKIFGKLLQDDASIV